jgi:tetratricopeptide (TPR) repeat protein
MNMPANGSNQDCVVFISYTHDSDEHRERVLGLSERLRDDGYDTRLDQYVNGTPDEGWPRWMMNRLDEATHVLVVCTETYHNRFRGHEEPGKGKGGDWEGALITQELYNSRSATTRFVPVLFSRDDEKHIPEPLRQHTHYTVTSKARYEELCDFLEQAAGVEPRSLGKRRQRERRTGTPMRFDDESDDSGSRSTPTHKYDLSRIRRYVPAQLVGREDELALIDAAWQSPEKQVLTFVALGGEGKTSLVAKWAAKLPPDCDAAFAWSFYSQGTRERGDASADVFLAEALRFFGEGELADSPASAWEKCRQLARVVGQRRALLILDGLEPLQYPPTSPKKGELKEDGLVALLSGLAETNDGLCLVTTRYEIPNLSMYRESTAPQVELHRLSTEAGVHLLHTLGVRPESGSAEDFRGLVEEVKGHALTLNLLGRYLAEAHSGDIRRRDRVKFKAADAEEQGGHAFRMMKTYVDWFATEEGESGQRAIALLKMMGLFDRAPSGDCIEALMMEPVIEGLTDSLVTASDEQRNIALARLEGSHLLSVDRDPSGELLSLDCHPLTREYFAKRLQEDQPEAWREGHKRLFEHLCETTEEGEAPTLEQLQPLYQAVAHGCYAGLHQQTLVKVYINRILKEAQFGVYYSAKTLGAIGADLDAISCFFEQRWLQVSDQIPLIAQGWLLVDAAMHLQSSGRLHEATEPMRAGMDASIVSKNWDNVSLAASNSSELSMLLGDMTEAIDFAEMSVKYADLSGKAIYRMLCRTVLANTLHYSGRSDDAQRFFAEAEDMQAKEQPHNPLLYSLRGFQYCDLLLASWELLVWRQLISDEFGKSEYIDGPYVSLDSIENRATSALQIAMQYRWLLDIALDHLTLARISLYRSRLEQIPCPNPHDHQSHIALAVDGLRKAGQVQELPRGLLTLAWYYHEHGDDDEARAVLREAEMIAARGPMPLYLADIHLYRARLFRDREELAKARELIIKHGYNRRLPELEDAESVQHQW